MTDPLQDLYAGYVQDGRWLAQATEWTEIRHAPHTRIWRVLDGGVERLAYWGRHPHDEDYEGWLSAVDPTIMLSPTHFRDLVRPPAFADAA